MDISQGLDSVAGGNCLDRFVRKVGSPNSGSPYVIMKRLRTGKLIGLVFGSLVVLVMLFMMFAVLGGLFSGEQ